MIGVAGWRLTTPAALTVFAGLLPLPLFGGGLGCGGVVGVSSLPWLLVGGEERRLERTSWRLLTRRLWRPASKSVITAVTAMSISDSAITVKIHSSEKFTEICIDF